MTLKQIKQAVEVGKTVHWMNDRYRVVKDSIGQWLIVCNGGSAIGLTYQNDVTMNGAPKEFFIAA